MNNRLFSVSKNLRYFVFSVAFLVAAVFYSGPVQAEIRTCQRLLADTSPIIKAQEFDFRLEKLMSEKSRLPEEGLFGPDSMLWKIQSEAAGRFGVGRIGILQMAHPQIAKVIGGMSEFKTSPLERFKATSVLMGQLVFSGAEKQKKLAKALFRIHDQVDGIARSNPLYSDMIGIVNNPEVMFWVHATYWQSRLMTYEMFVRKLSAEEIKSYYEDTIVFARLLGIPDEFIPKTFEDFNKYMDEKMQTLVVSEDSRKLVQSLAYNSELYTRYLPKILAESSLVQDLIISFSGHMIPERLSQELNLPKPFSDIAFKLTVSIVSQAYKLLPERYRLTDSYKSIKAAKEEGSEVTEQRKCPFSFLHRSKK